MKNFLLNVISQWIGYTISMSLLWPVIKAVGDNELAMLLFGLPAVFAAWWGGGYFGLAIESLFDRADQEHSKTGEQVNALMLFFGPAIGAVTAFWLWG